MNIYKLVKSAMKILNWWILLCGKVGFLIMTSLHDTRWLSGTPLQVTNGLSPCQSSCRSPPSRGAAPRWGGASASCMPSLHHHMYPGLHLWNISILVTTSGESKPVHSSVLYWEEIYCHRQLICWDMLLKTQLSPLATYQAKSVIIFTWK